MYRSRGVISCSIQLENGWLAAATTRSPFLAARSITSRLSRTSSAAGLGGGPAHRGADLDHRLMELGLHFAQQHRVFLEDLRDVGAECARGRVDDLIFLLDAERQAGAVHGEIR